MRNLPLDLTTKINQSLQTIANDAQPKMQVSVARAKTTVMDSSYWTVETIRTKEGIGDISVAARRLKSYGRIDRIYEIHVDNGIVKTTLREYPDKLKTGWQPQFELGPGSAVAIAFDGEWERWRDLWRLKTTEKPWIMWVDGAGVLWTQLWDEPDTKLELSTNVVSVRSIRGWKNFTIQANDQGIVVAYIKTDGKVYYRNYSQQADYSIVWEFERQLTDFTGSAANLNLFITNDYRMGFVIEDTDGVVTWYITHRNWVGMAIAPEYIKASVGGSIELIEIEKTHAFNLEQTTASISGDITLLFAKTDLSINNAENTPITLLDELGQEYQDWGWVVEFSVIYPIPDLQLSQVFLEAATSGTNIILSDLYQVSEKVYQITADSVVESGFNNILEDLKVTITGATNPAGYTYDTAELVFSPTNLEPTFIPLPEVEVIWNE